ncbi:MAG: type I DNA topoisomerase [Candidatus Andersenbacteria bacterium]|nr:type I DNA topoisomerase [Candidatus Andersenbacteria bacterium]MBI3251010.1 type I DNA topoisomerase [Candidatus Andersenbacteria bacterium]
MNLVIVESPAKAKTIQKYLGKGFIVKSSYGHVRDLPKSKLGVDVENDFEPKYVIPVKARPHIKELQAAAKKADIIYFATDEDREGEAIAWHLAEILKVKPSKAKRITFAEITKSAIQKAIDNPREINQPLVDAQQSRRILDRLVGYELSPLLWKKVRRGLSAGRVQSVAVRLIVEREEEIKAFKPQEYWTVDAHLAKENTEFTAYLYAKDGKAFKKLEIETKEQTEKVLTELQDASYVVTDVAKKERKRTPPPPFTTSTLQQAAYNQLGFSSKRTMMLAQQLYENGHITYMRTDSVNLAAEATAKAKETIEQTFGKEYALPSPRFYKTKSKGAQEAHEAIRPTDPARLPETLASEVEPSHIKLYRLIWQRMVASQMTEARLEQTSADISAGTYTFRAIGTTVVFDGFVRALGEKAAFKETVLPPLEKDDSLAFRKLQHEQHFTQPPARYSEATLVKALEEHGIGRPSTYAPIIDTIQRREYVVKNDEKRLAPTEIGTLVNGVLTEHFPNIVDIAFTAAMEEDLDEVASGNKQWQPLMKEFYDPFHKQIKTKDKELKKSDITEEKTGEKCPDCGNELVIKLGRFGKFKACSNYPDCKHTEPIGEEKELQQEHTGEMCPDCGKPLVVKRGRFGPFLGCSGYPDCKHIKKIEKEIGVNCPKCGEGKIIEKRSRRGKIFFACNRYPKCENAYWSKPNGEKCPTCDSLLVYGAKNTIRCSNKECKFTKENEQD